MQVAGRHGGLFVADHSLPPSFLAPTTGGGGINSSFFHQYTWMRPILFVALTLNQSCLVFATRAVQFPLFFTTHTIATIAKSDSTLGSQSDMVDGSPSDCGCSRPRDCGCSRPRDCGCSRPRDCGCGRACDRGCGRSLTNHGPAPKLIKCVWQLQVRTSRQ
jgi:hypothetical protein